MELLNRWKKQPVIIRAIETPILLLCLYGIYLHITQNYSISEILGVLAFSLLVISAAQDNIINLRLYSAAAGVCFAIQFTMSDLPIINVIGQMGLVCYGLFKAHNEFKK